MLDAASGGSIVDKTPTEAREIISTMAATSQDFGDSQDMPRTVNEASISSIESKLNQLTNMSLEQQMSQIATSVSKLESQGKLPSQTETNPKHNVCAITLRSGKELKNAPPKLRRGHALEANPGTEPEAELEVNKHADHEQKEEKQFPPAELTAKLRFPERYPNLVSSVCKIDIVHPVLQQTLEFLQQDKSIEMLIDDVNLNHLEKPNVNSSNDEKEPEFELKPPLEYLKFAYLGDEPYDSAKIYKDKTQGFYDQEIFRQQFVLGQKVFVDDSELSLFSSKLQS
ncbi:uncharacterized protein G2W53_001400 [Senna tora]|uniref:Uncharacterized protein n=1 Tax=Senna tora TaxID=362788 RepID=A0A834XFH2_9FABA|nr:uncharacterized protein G2W53_001400 [Senna tora]